VKSSSDLQRQKRPTREAKETTYRAKKTCEIGERPVDGGERGSEASSTCNLRRRIHA